MEEQYNIGENKVGIEIKFDDILKDTNNLWIEVAEKRNSNNMNWVESGICRKDNCWGYLIGDYLSAYLFLKKHLIQLKDKYPDKLPIKTNNTLTSQGFLLSKDKAEKFKLHKFIFRETSKDNMMSSQETDKMLSEIDL